VRTWLSRNIMYLIIFFWLAKTILVDILFQASN